MTTLTQLIERYCPDGVEYVRLGDVAEVARKTCQPARMGTGSVVLYSLPAFDQGLPERVNPAEIKSGKTILSKPSLLVPKLNPRKPRVWLVEEPSPRSYCSTEFFPIQADNSSLSLSYLYYIICDTISELALLVDGGSNSHKRLNRDIYLDLLFPLPPREVQDAIVERLDAFAALIESLDSEIVLREKRFEYFREQIFSALDHDEPLGAHGTFYRGRGIQKKDFRDTGKPAFHYGQVHTRYGLSTSTTAALVSDEVFYQSAHASPGDLIIATTSEDDDAVGKAVVWLGQEQAAVGGDAHFFEHSYDPRFIGYFFTTHSFHDQKIPYLTGAKVRRINAKSLASIRAPWPPREVQQEIAEKLDTMRALIDNLKQERDLRNAQFEYYREKLLTFNS